MQSTLGIFDDLTGSVFFGDYDRDDTDGFFWVTWIFGTVVYSVVVAMGEKELPVISKRPNSCSWRGSLSEVKPPNVSRQLNRPRPDIIRQGAHGFRQHDAHAGERFAKAVVEPGIA
jgi:hypothetical protein